ncbi:MAG TPA: hypothetical protein VGY57_00760 [Vicinamibacterales bacterium]|nr:hypothetical protein [Vicinamibacterales bacterium]
MTRREFMRLAAATLGTAALPVDLRGDQRSGAAPTESQDPRRGRSPGLDSLNLIYGDIRRHFIFEYYPWYGADPIRHWDQDGRVPPIDLASNYVPRLGAYDSRSTAVIEQHARWIADAGTGAINISWWGRDSFEDKAVTTVMDVMRAHDIHVTFHLEPYGDRRVDNYASDIQYLMTQYGDRRHWDCMLLLQHADGAVGPVFKSFFTILSAQQTDCHGVTTPNPFYVADGAWRQQTDRVREMFRRDFDRVTILSDSLDMGRMQAGGFDGAAIYSNYVRPETWRSYATAASTRGLVFSFNVNPGFDSIAARSVAPNSCYTPFVFEPPTGPYDWSAQSERERAKSASASRIADSFHTTVDLQRDRHLSNATRGFFLVYICSFNEWHEGHQFEPMKDAADLTPAERAIGYHNPADGSYRLKLLTSLIAHAID